MSLKIKELSKIYKTPRGKQTVLSGLNLELSNGELFALMGANGCGKTTLLKIVSALVLPTSGGVFVSGINTTQSPRETIARTGLVSDADGSFYQMLSAEDNLKFFARLYGVRENIIAQRVTYLLEKLKMREYGKEKFSHLSSGIKQRLAFARALVHEPEILLIDEAARSLDENSLNEISGYIKEECKKCGKTCLVVTHDKAWARRYCSRIGILENGKIES
jgi:ABC-type multidrug transport system ATPase subunit